MAGAGTSGRGNGGWDQHGGRGVISVVYILDVFCGWNVQYLVWIRRGIKRVGGGGKGEGKEGGDGGRERERSQELASGQVGTTSILLRSRGAAVHH